MAAPDYYRPVVYGDSFWSTLIIIILIFIIAIILAPGGLPPTNMGLQRAGMVERYIDREGGRVCYLGRLDSEVVLACFWLMDDPLGGQ